MSSKASFASLVSLLAIAQLVAGHGYIAEIAVDGEWRSGNKAAEFQDITVDSAIRQPASQDPIKLDKNPEDLPCGVNPQNAAQVWDVMPGSNLTIWWYDQTQHWPHDIGPVMTYMTTCGDTSCDKFDPTGASWFKIDQKGFKPGSNVWWQRDMFENQALNVTIPQNLAPGGYLLRNEILGLHIAADVPGGPEFYPSCTQLNVGGNGDGHPDTFVTFPEVYQQDPSLYDNVYGLNDETYKFPAGPVAQIVSGGNTKRADALKASDSSSSNKHMSYFSWRSALGIH